eukprot:873392-Prymnesium_polylepis.1
MQRLITGSARLTVSLSGSSVRTGGGTARGGSDERRGAAHAWARWLRGGARTHERERLGAHKVLGLERREELLQCRHGHAGFGTGVGVRHGY